MIMPTNIYNNYLKKILKSYYTLNDYFLLLFIFDMYMYILYLNYNIRIIRDNMLICRLQCVITLDYLLIIL
jgi:hypothetical protein